MADAGAGVDPGPLKRPDVPLAALHKARLQWLGATDAMLAESIGWLTMRGYETSSRALGVGARSDVASTAEPITYDAPGDG
jgi:hypothetical protein